MKRSIKLVAIAAILAGSVLSCDKYDDSALKADISSLQNRVSTLESQAKQANSDIASLNTIVNALKNNVFVSSVTESSDGYTIKFSDGKTATIKNGKDGAAGADGITPQFKIESDSWYVSFDKGSSWTKLGKATGEKGDKGDKGADGVTPQLKIDGGYWYSSTDKGSTWIQLGKATGEKGDKGDKGSDGQTPSIGVKQDSDGVYYWTLDGGWLLSPSGEKIATTGANGADGTTPQLKIEDGCWFISTDNGASWTKLGKATGEDGDSFFKGVGVEDSYVTFMLADGTTFSLARGANGVQQIIYVPRNADGSVEAWSGDVPLKFTVLPLAAAKSVSLLEKDCFSLTAVYTRTKASEGDKVNVPVRTVGFDGEDIVVTADCSALGAEFFNKALGSSLTLIINDGVRTVSSGYFALDPNPTRGTAAVKSSAGRPGNVCGWVQLWAGGPKFAEFNVGAIISYYGDLIEETNDVGGTGSVPLYNTENVGSLCNFQYPYLNGRTKLYQDDEASYGKEDIATYCWGENWRTPTSSEMSRLVELVWTWCDGETTQYCKGCTLAGFKISGDEGYEGNNIFLPAAGDYWPPSQKFFHVGERLSYNTSTGAGGPNSSYLGVNSAGKYTVLAGNACDARSTRAVLVE